MNKINCTNPKKSYDLKQYIVTLSNYKIQFISK